MFIEPQRRRTSPLQECLLVLDVLPEMEPPRAVLLESQPPPNGTG